MTQKPLCPICERKLVTPEFKPFCSKLCADVDLARWLSDGYAIPGEPVDQADDAPGSEPGSGRGEVDL